MTKSLAFLCETGKRERKSSGERGKWQKKKHFRRMQLALSQETFQPLPSIQHVLKLKYGLTFKVGFPSSNTHQWAMCPKSRFRIPTITIQWNPIPSFSLGFWNIKEWWKVWIHDHDYLGSMCSAVKKLKLEQLAPPPNLIEISFAMTWKRRLHLICYPICWMVQKIQSLRFSTTQAF